MIEEFDGYCQVVFILEADFGIALFVKDSIVSYAELSKMFEN
jgi:hypothetical protein